MADALAPRGPDGEGIAVWENVGLVNRRPAVVDPGPAGAQPMADPSDRWLVTFNGEVYNHLELRPGLQDGPWRGHSDTETLCRALAAWGPAAVERCNGPLAVAALDRSERRLVLARDRIGKKPLYMARENGTIWFASELRAMLAAGLRPVANIPVLRHAATRGWASGRATPLQGIRRLGPGSTVVLDLESLTETERRWYDPAEVVDPGLVAQLAHSPRRELAGRLEDELGRAVRRRLMADVPVGTLCSGGLDSSLVTAMAAAEQPVTAFACSLPDESRRLDEARWAERVAGHLGIELVTTAMNATVFRDALVRTVWLHEYPLNGPSSVPISLMSQLARDRGVKVLLTGEGADELFAGYTGLERIPLHSYLPGWVMAYREAAAVLAYGRPAARVIWRRRRGVARDPGGPLEPSPEPVELYSATRERARRAYSHHDGVEADLESALVTDLTVSHFPFLLNRMDKDAMAASIETRLPFLDPAVISLALNLPLRARTYPRVKGILRDVGRRWLPRKIAYRSKHPGMTFDARRRIEEAARPEFLADGHLRNLLEVPAAEWEDMLSAVTPRIGARLWSAEIWARLFIARDEVERVESELWAGGAG